MEETSTENGVAWNLTSKKNTYIFVWIKKKKKKKKVNTTVVREDSDC